MIQTGDQEPPKASGFIPDCEMMSTVQEHIKTHGSILYILDPEYHLHISLDTEINSVLSGWMDEKFTPKS